MNKTDHIAAPEGELKIYAIHHASFVMAWQGKHIFIDPAPLEERGTGLEEFRGLPKPDLIVYTHDHYDHYNAGILEAIVAPDTNIVVPQHIYDQLPSLLKPRAMVLAEGAKADVGGIPVEVVAMHNTTSNRLKFHPKGWGNGYVLTLGETRVYVAGDTEETPELAQLENIGIAFVPVNQPYTQTVEEAASWVKKFKPRIVYPYHFRNADGSLSDMRSFVAQVGAASDVRVLEWY